ncbi:MAG TPA: polyprenyl synthetase family protein [Anaerolineaceae bacterium]|nr:polyprenyl synthetase family protein [Anaerolineaceae bacterium]
MTKITFSSPVQEGIQDVENLMRAQAEGYDPDLGAALEHLLSSGGKRIRPALTLLTGKMLGGDYDRLVTLGAAIELLHTATLVHDDLIDNSLLRRGIPTLNSQWSPGATVLTGDFIFARAANLSAQTESIAAMKLFAQTLVIIVNGEISQLFSNRIFPDRESYFARIYEKTASLFETSTAAAAIISEVDAGTIEYVRQFGFKIGMAFQIVDDILDFTGEQTTIGKPVGSDLRQGIVTLPAILYADKNPANPDVQLLKQGSLQSNEVHFIRLVESIRRSDAIDLAYEEARNFVQTGLEVLACLPESPERAALADIAEYILHRQQ